MTFTLVVKSPISKDLKLGISQVMDLLAEN